MRVSPGQNALATRGGVPRRLLKTKDAAYYLGVSTWKVRKLAIDGKLQYVADAASGPWLFDIRDLDAYIEANKRTI
jgi:excisionase family DNA binding protein